MSRLMSVRACRPTADTFSIASPAPSGSEQLTATKAASARVTTTERLCATMSCISGR